MRMKGVKGGDWDWTGEPHHDSMRLALWDTPGRTHGMVRVIVLALRYVYHSPSPLQGSITESPPGLNLHGHLQRRALQPGPASSH